MVAYLYYHDDKDDDDYDHDHDHKDDDDDDEEYADFADGDDVNGSKYGYAKKIAVRHFSWLILSRSQTGQSVMESQARNNVTEMLRLAEI